MKKSIFFFRSGGAPGLLREYLGLLRSEKSMKNAKLRKFSKNHKKLSFPKLVPRGGPGLLEGRGGQNRKFDPGPPGAPGGGGDDDVAKNRFWPRNSY